MTGMLHIYLHNGWLATLAILVALFGVGRLARIITWDAFPPAIAVRQWWNRITDDGPWAKLFNCFWCMTPWLMLGSLGWFVLGLYVDWIAIAWWLFWGWLALSYASSIIIARDEPQD